VDILAVDSADSTNKGVDLPLAMSLLRERYSIEYFSARWPTLYSQLLLAG